MRRNCEEVAQRVQVVALRRPREGRPGRYTGDPRSTGFLAGIRVAQAASRASELRALGIQSPKPLARSQNYQKVFLISMNNNDKGVNHVKLAFIVLALALLVPLAFSAPVNDGNTNIIGEAIDILHPNSEHVSDAVSKASEGVFVGSIKSDKYHYPSCQWAEKIKPENEIWFSSSQDARNQGYVPCKVCSPP